ncbi:MAG: chemotaxis protein CheA [Deltaproteobacteria bacterium]|nr:MAG: chemotaxis protein CheA [Deltaproteobacteria bacterium]
MAEGPHKFLPLFITEAGEQLQQLGAELVKLEQEPAGGPVWDAVFRRLHSLKGGAATVGIKPIVEIAHEAEALVSRLKASGARPERAQIDLLLQASDALTAQLVRVVDDLARASKEEHTGNSALLARLAEASKAVVVPDVTPTPAPVKQPAAPPPVDPSLPRLDIFFSLSKTCQAPGARALIVQRKLKAVGTLLEMEPSPQQLMQKKGGVQVAALLATDHSIEDVRAAFNGIPEVESVEVQVAPVASMPAIPEGPTPPPGQLRPVTETSVSEDMRPEATIRVHAQALDQLLDQAAEVLHGIARLREAARKLPEAVAPAFEAEVDRLRRTARDLHGRVMNARLTPFSALTERLPRSVRDLAHRLGKEVDLEVQGAEVELDRTLIDALGDPLTHLVRNAIDHGLESSQTRIAAGKPKRGKLLLAARRERDKVLVDVIDDGAGFDAARLRDRAVGMGAISAERAAELNEHQSFELAFLPGLSTRPEATEVSGRGVGLDAVKSAIEALGGKLSLRSTPGKGTQFTLELPLSVSMANLLLVQVGGEMYGLPMARVVVTTEYDLSARGGEGFEARSLAVMGQLVRAYSLAKLFGLPSLAPPGPRPFAVLEVDGLTFALSVDRLVGQEEAVLKPLFPPLDRIKGLAGTTVLGNGRPLLVLDPRGVHELAETAARLKGAA